MFFTELNIFLLIFEGLILSLCWSFDENTEWAKATSFYMFTVKDIDEQTVNLSDYKGNCSLVVNVASKCGLTKITYEQLLDLEKKYSSRGLIIIAYPCNQFANQEPGTNQEIKSFAMERGVVPSDKFLLCAKGDVNGNHSIPMYKWLKSKKQQEDEEDITWNFTKFLVGKNGKVLDRYPPKFPPKNIEGKIKACLAAK